MTRRTWVDVNVYFGQWPFRSLPQGTPEEEADHLAARDVTQMWVSSFEGMLHRDVDGVNRRLSAQCRAIRTPECLPFGTVNPRMPDWREDMRRCAEDYRMPGIRLFPNYHGYDLQEGEFHALLDAAVEYGLVVQLARKMEDERTHHPLMAVPPVDLEPLGVLVEERPSLRIVLLNALRDTPPAQLESLVAAGQVFVEIAMLEGVGGLERLIGLVPPERVLFGSYAPFFYWEASAGKLQESAVGGALRDAVRGVNAERLLGGSAR